MFCIFFFFKQKTAYEVRISDWSSDVCSSDLFHYSRPLLPFLALVSVLTAAISVAEVVFIGFMGRLVDRLGSSDPATFFADHGRELAGMALLVVVIYPLLVLMHSLLTHQTTFGN